MSIKKLFDKNRQAITVSKYLKKSAPGDLGDGIESAEDLKEKVERREYFLPPVDYGNPENFVKYGSAQRYYTNAFNYILNYYPYDGSSLEKTEFYNDISPLEKYMLEDVYPKSTGYVFFGSTAATAVSNSSGYYSVTTPEYIQVKGGPHLNTFYNEPKYRTSNLEFGGATGTTVEFFLHKESPINPAAESSKQVILDLTNGAATGSSGYGRLRVEIESGSAGNTDRFYVTMRSGSNGFTRLPVPTTGGLNIANNTWQYYSLVFNTSPADPTIDFFIDGKCISTAITGASGEISEVTGTMIGNLGALRASPSGSAYHGTLMEGSGNLNASMDEFRFWKKNRNDEEVGRHWFSHVYGGSNKYDANVSLGVYYKFNEGITATSSIDSVVLDYSGRVSNGQFINYNSSTSRNTGSAVDTLQLTDVKEVPDPIVRASNPLYVTSKDKYALSGSNYDYTNNSWLMNFLPSWIIDDDHQNEGELGNLLQIVAMYFDSTKNQIKGLQETRFIDYISGSLEATLNDFPHNDRLIESLGMATPEFFENAGVLQQFLKRDEQINFDQRVVDIKNAIYKNLYNNLNYIFKSKGNEKAIRNFIRCLGVGDEIISLNTYSDNADFRLTSSYTPTVSDKRFVDFTGLLNQSDDYATVYQYYDSSNPNSVGILSASTSGEFAMTMQGTFVFPDKTHYQTLDYTLPTVISASLYGFHTPLTATTSSTDLTWASAVNDFGLQVYAVKSPGEYADIYSPLEQVRDAYFVVKDRAGTTLLTSSIFHNVYDGQKWNLSLSVRPKNYPYTDGVTGSSAATTGYTLELYGVNYDTGIKRNYFQSTADYALQAGLGAITSAKRAYLGAHRTNFTGSGLVSTDVRGTSLRYWTDYIPPETVDFQANEVNTFGRKDPYRNAYSFQTAKPPVYIPRIQTLALNWDFANITGSNASGQFPVSDFSSGSVDGKYPSEYQHPTFSNINLRQHTGRGDFFTTNSTPVRKDYVYRSKLEVPEYIGSDTMVKVLNSDDTTFGVYVRPISFFFAVEKSMYESISHRMLALFASIDEFNNLIGEPVNKYRIQYKRMEKIREIFFRKVRNDIPDLDKYVRFYKWLDTAMTEMIEQLFPESSRYAKSVRKIVENHVLERPKIQYKLPYLKKKEPWYPGDPEFTVFSGSICVTAPGWGKNHHPISDSQTENCFWWRTRSTPPNASPIRPVVLRAIDVENRRNRIVCLSSDFRSPYIGGINQEYNKKRRISNITFDQFGPLPDCEDYSDPNVKTKVPFRVLKDGVGYPGDQLSPFTAISASISSGYNAVLNSAGLTGISLNNLHEDSVFPFRHSVPMQGPFTKRWVGGIQARHNAALRSLDRKEEFTLAIASGTGSISNITPGSIPQGRYLRGMGSKSPVNISNILTVTSSHTDSQGLRQVGNFVKRYETVSTVNRAATNMDFVFNTSFYQYSMPTAFLRTPTRAAAGLSGSADYPAPRQRSGRRINETIFVERFESPGGKATSKQQFRDVNSDQYAPNNALPYRNIGVRAPYNSQLKEHTRFGGWQNATETIPSVHKNPKNGILRIGITTTLPTAAYATGSFYNNGFLVSPLPAADRSQWTSYISGSDNQAVYNQYVALWCRYPENISFVTSSIESLFPVGYPGVYLNTANKKEFLWAHNRDFVPWKQVRAGESAAGRYYVQNNVYELPPLVSDELNASGIRTESYKVGTLTRTVSNRTNQPLTYSFSAQYREPPITSRYKQLIKHISTPIGTPASTSTRQKNIQMQSTYGNDLMGFASRGLNQYYRTKKWLHGQIKRPYEIIRDLRAQQVQDSVDGLDTIHLMAYPETIYPKEVYTYFSGSRARLSFIYPNWKDDKKLAAGLDATTLTNYRHLISPLSASTFNRQITRVQSPFTNSVGYPVLKIDQTPYASPSALYSIPTGAGSGSIWPLDSFLYSDYITPLATVTAPSGKPIVLADAGTMAAGELMMTNYGTVNDGITDTADGGTSNTAYYNTSSIYSAQYPYNIPVTELTCSTTSASNAYAIYYQDIYEGQGNAKAEGELELGSSADGSTLAGASVTIEIDDTTGTKTFEFTAGSSANVFDAAANKYAVGVQNADLSWFTKEEARNQLYDAIVSGRTDSSPLDIDAPVKSGTDTIELTAGTAGTAFNSEPITSTDTSITGITPTTWFGGTDYTLNSETLDLTDVAHGTVSYIFDAATAPAASTAGIIGVLGASSLESVAQGVVQTIGLSYAAGNINITGTYSGAGMVTLVASVAGTAMNTKTLAGTSIAGGYAHASAFASGSGATTSCFEIPQPKSPGSVYTRPPWTAGSSRRVVDGLDRGDLLTSGHGYPFYNSYEKFVEDSRLAGKDYTIIPEFRISEHVEEYNTSSDPFSLVSSSMELTGASDNLYDGTNGSFYERYAQTDVIEFLSDFMPNADARANGDSDFVFNNFPRHFEMSSDTIIKLLPYDGFYPVKRSTQLATHFSQSFLGRLSYNLGATSYSPTRVFLRPTFAPGIFYNSIKSGIAVDYPVRRPVRNANQFLPISASVPLGGGLSGSLTVTVSGTIPGNRRRPNEGDNPNFDFSNPTFGEDINKFFWADRLPFETILNPAPNMGFIDPDDPGLDQEANLINNTLVLSDVNQYMSQDVSGSFKLPISGTLYHKAISNFLANVPRFFLTKKENKFGEDGYLTKFVSRFGGVPNPKVPDSDQNPNAPRTVNVEKGCYMMEVGLMKTSDFNLYSNPYAFGHPTATGSSDWDALAAEQLPAPLAWPSHRAEFAPFTPPYYYGPSLARIAFLPRGDKDEYTLDEIVNNTRGELFVRYLNDHEAYYDMTSGSYIDNQGNVVSSIYNPPYGWNRAWQNRMDIDASVVIGNEFPTGFGSYKSLDPNKWTVMPKWESPVLDFPSSREVDGTPRYNFSASVTPGEYTTETQGMWHQYGVMPQSEEGVYMFMKDVSLGEYDKIGITKTGTTYAVEAEFVSVEKAPRVAVQNGLPVRSLASLCGFDPDEIMTDGFDISKAKRIGEIARDGEKTLSEAILAMPYYIDPKNQPRFITLQAPAEMLGPKIKEFRKHFTKYSLPPKMSQVLKYMVPPGYPSIPDLITPFGLDEYDAILENGRPTHVPVIYLMEHKVSLNRQDVADIWQGIMPELSRTFQMSFSSIDHYMPGDNVEINPTQFPEVLRSQIDLGVTRTGHPRYDLLDIASDDRIDNGLFPEIKWLVFKVKEKGLCTYTQMVMEEVDGEDILSYDNPLLPIPRPNNDDQRRSWRDRWSSGVYLADHSVLSPTYNWPYDYFSLIEHAKVNTKIGFRPDLQKEMDESFPNGIPDE